MTLYKKGQENDFLQHWEQIKKEYTLGQTDPKKLVQAKKHLNDLIKHIMQETPKHMEDDPPDDESPNAAASRLVLYMLLYVNDGPGATPPPYFPGADNAVGLLTPNAPLTLITEEGGAGVHFDKGSTLTDRIIVITSNPNPYTFPCSGPLYTTLCQYPLFFDIQSFPDDVLLKTAVASVCHPEVGEPYGPPDEATHDRLRLAHTAPESPSAQVDGGTVLQDEGNNIEILPLVSQSFHTCTDVEYDPPPGDFYDLVALRELKHLAIKVGKFFLPKSAYAIDQGGGGGFSIFSPFNNVDTQGVELNEGGGGGG
ncbi:MAG TPA: hypothetical protein VM099_16655 [Gemmatimonadaceae bacterium]|nr:hypothetical protein [Gemmatimonadaceae bacterium]